MSSSGDVGVLRPEDSARMPAWKRELLERRKAKGGETTPRSGPKSEDEATGSETRRHAASPATSPVKTKDPWPSPSPSPSSSHPNGRANDTDDDDGCEDGVPESLVLSESLGPLQENPFIKLEKERKKRREKEKAARPLQHVLELYGSVPGIRTIRAENIIIIESDPDYFPEGAGRLKHGSKPQQNGTVSGYSSLNDLLDCRGSPVTEIRAREVVVYDTALSRSEENLSTLGRPAGDLTELVGDGQSHGRVSRMLQKFDRNYGKLQGKSRSSENLLDLDSGSSRMNINTRPRVRTDMVPKYAASPQPSSPVHLSQNQLVTPAPVFQNSQSSTTKPHISAGESVSSSISTSTTASESPQLVSSFRRRFEASGGRGITVNPREEAERSQAKPVRERDWDSTDGASKAKVPCSPESHRARAELSSSPATAATEPPTSPSFEIRPSPRPDLSTLPAGDLQARALANLRLQSRKSFTVIPKRREVAQSSTSPVPSLAPSSPSPSLVPSSPVFSPEPSSPVLSPAHTVPTPTSPTSLPAVLFTEKVAVIPKPLSPTKTKPASPLHSFPTPQTDPTPPLPSSPSKSMPPSSPQEPKVADKLPITNIDDVEVEPSPPFPSPMVQRRKGNTFTVVPKRRSEPQPATTEAQEPASTPQGSPSTPQAPYAQLGTLLKKRYPAVEEIEVIGGYLSLGRSCLSKTGSTGKKLKISFNESSLQSTFEYPSETSAWDSGEDEEDGGRRGGGGGEGGSEEERSGISMERLRIPRPSYTSSPITHTPNSTDLSNYTPKNSVEFTAWQDHKNDDPAHLGDTNSQRTNMSEEVMLTPADSSSLTDFSSEPALYF
ncbi:taperin [Astyanax mexicanus]|uniref:Taperin n=1 Tax=Astyanax mexicanus TaxID=7994 RepID=A0A8T2MFB0_ASTMX|nr:taperin [Astyanax mexicanus]